MKFHDTRGMYDEIAKWLEENDVEVDWEAVMQCKWWVGPKDWVPPPKWSMPVPFPSRLTPQTATKLLFTQWWHGLYIRPELGDPLDNYVAPRMTSHQIESLTCHQQRGGEGVEPGPAGDAATGPNPWKIFLKHLAAIDRIEVIELKLISAEDRRALVRMAWIEEELRRREVEHNRERVKRQTRGEAKWYLSRKREGWLREKASHGNLEAIQEMERRGYGSMEEHKGWRELNRKLVENMREVREKRKRKAKEQESDMGKKEEKIKGVGKVEVVQERVWLGEEQKVEVSEPKRWEEIEELDKPDKVEKEAHKGIERELEVVRVGPNPRILTCRYKELASERVCKVGVKSAANFVCGMKFRMAEPSDSLEFASVWRYEGKLPRARGRW
jgi:hypothetical protein